MKYEESDIIDVWVDDKIEEGDLYFFGNSKEALLQMANDPKSKPLEMLECAEDAFYVLTDDEDMGSIEKYEYAIPFEKPYRKAQSYKIGYHVDLSADYEQLTYQKSREEAVQDVVQYLKKRYFWELKDRKVKITFDDGTVIS